MKKKRNQFIAVLLTCTLLISIFSATLAPVSATTSNEITPELYTYNSALTDFSANKLSHPGTGVGLPDGVIDSPDGTPDEGLSYAWSAVAYGNDVYIGLLDSAVYVTILMMAQSLSLTTEQINAMIDVLWKGEMYNGPLGLGCIVKLDTVTNEVKIIEQNKTRGYRTATIYNEKVYFVNTNTSPQLLEIDPNTDEVEIVYTSDPITDKTVSSGIRALTVHNDSLVFSTNTDNGPIMLKSDNPSLGQDSFELIGTNADFLNYPGYRYTDGVFGGGVWEMVSYNNKLYIVVVTGQAQSEDPETPFAIFSAHEDENGEWIYTPVVGKDGDGSKYPLGLGDDRSMAATLYVFNNHLYIGAYNDPMVALPAAITQLDFRRIYEDLSSPVQLWRMDSNEDIELVAGSDNDVFPETLGNMPAGFDSNLNQYIWRMSDYDDKLFVGTFDIGSLAYPLMQFTNGDVLKWTEEDIQEELEYIIVLLEAFGITVNTDNIEVAKNSTNNQSSNNNSDIVLSQEDLDFVENNNNEETIEKLQELKSGLEIIENSIDDVASEESTVTIERNNSELTPTIPTDITVNSEDLLALLLSLQTLLESIEQEGMPAELQSLLETVLTTENLQNYDYFIETCKYLSEGERGFSLLVSEDGINFDIITSDGFGDPNNHGIRSFAQADTGLVIGTANPFKGSQIWQLVDESDPQPVYEVGDVDLDGNITIKDAIIVMQMLAKIGEFTDQQYDLADVDGNGNVTISDAISIQKIISKLPLS